MKKSKIAKRLDVSNEFWKQFGIQDENTRKVMGLYEVESIDDPNICTVAIKPKEYLKIKKLIKNIKALDETIPE